MEALTDLLSMIVFFLIWLIPLLFIFVSRKRTTARGESEKPIEYEEYSREEAEPKVSTARRNTAGNERAENFIARLMEIQGIEPHQDGQPQYAPRQDRPEVSKGRAAQQKQQQEVRSADSLMKKQGQTPTMKPMVPMRRKKRASLRSLESYPVGQQAIILSEIIGKPKAFSDDL